MKILLVATASVVAIAAAILPTTSATTSATKLPPSPSGHPFEDLGTRGHPQRKLIVGGEFVPSGTKTYSTILRTTLDGDVMCTGSLISPTHVLTAAHCFSSELNWASVGAHSLNNTEQGENIQVLAMMLHPNYTAGGIFLSSDFMILELARPSTIKPVKLAASDESEFKTGEWATVMGWGRTGDDEPSSNDLKRVDVQLKSDEECSKFVKIDSTMLCAGMVLNEGDCYGDSGGPLIKTMPNGEDVLIGSVSWTEGGCAKGINLSVFGRVSHARVRINQALVAQLLDLIFQYSITYHPHDVDSGFPVISSEQSIVASE